jgi:hypothetical protein
LQLLVVFALLDLRESQQVFDDRVQAVRLLGNDSQEALGIDRVFFGAIEQRLHEAFDRSDGRLELMRHVGDKISADHFQFAEIGDVVEHDHGADRAPVDIV